MSVGITLVRNSSPRRRRRNARLALVLSGGAISGGAFKIGGLIALNQYIQNVKVTDFDIYVGLSAGALLAAPLASGVPPEELLRSLSGTSPRISRMRMRDFYYPNVDEFSRKPAKLLRDIVALGPQVGWAAARYVRRSRREVWKFLGELVRHPNMLNLELLALPILRAIFDSTDLPYASSYLPAGIFDNQRIERYLRRNLERNRVPNNFRLLQTDRSKALYILATDADTAEQVIFGPDEVNNVSISEAVQASTALPIFYKPPRIAGHDYLDAGLLKTANIHLAVAKGADLVIVYNPFRPWHFSRETAMGRHFEHLSDLGLPTLINQSVRAMLHSRLHLSLEQFARDPNFHGDIICIEPAETDHQFFSINPVAFWKRAEAAEHGFASTRRSIEICHAELRELFAGYGIEVDLAPLRRAQQLMAEARQDDFKVLRVLERRAVARRAPLRVVREAVAP